MFVPFAGGLLLRCVGEYRGVLNESAGDWVGVEVKGPSVGDEGGVRAYGVPLTE